MPSLDWIEGLDINDFTFKISITAESTVGEQKLECRFLEIRAVDTSLERRIMCHNCHDILIQSTVPNNFNTSTNKFHQDQVKDDKARCADYLAHAT